MGNVKLYVVTFGLVYGPKQFFFFSLVGVIFFIPYLRFQLLHALILIELALLVAGRTRFIRCNAWSDAEIHD